MNRLESLNIELFSQLPKYQRDEVMTIENECDLEPRFMGFVATYFHLSHLIPRDWTVVDIGCAFNPQCYYFRDHKKDIAVEPSVGKMFHMDNTKIYRCTASEFVEEFLPKLGLDIDKTFAICNAVPPWYGDNVGEIVRKAFTNCYVFYPK